VILANGPIGGYSALKPALQGCGLLIACDGGLRHARVFEAQPDIILGDMDSVPPELLAEETAKGVPVFIYPAEKDYTDLALAVELAIQRDAASITVLGGLCSGAEGRLDHALANMHALASAAALGIQAELLDEHTHVFIISNTRACTLYKGQYDTVSLIPLTTEAKGIVTSGLYYPLNGGTLKAGSTLGVSNRFTDEEASVSLAEGILAVIANISAAG